MKLDPSFKRFVVITGAAASALVIVVAIASYLFLGSRAQPRDPPQYVGRVSGTDAFFGINKAGQNIRPTSATGPRATSAFKSGSTAWRPAMPST